jgi:putative peptidoglycan lipid II flippase
VLSSTESIPSADRALPVSQTDGGGRLAGAAAVMMAAVVASRLTGLLRDIAITYQFGTGREMDAYLAAIRVPDLVFQVFAGGAVASAFIPVFTGYLAARDSTGAWRMVSTLLNVSVVVLLPVILVLIALADPLMSALGAGFDIATRALAAELARLLMISPLFFTIGCFVTSILNANQRFVLAAIAPASYNLGIMFGAVVLAPSFGIRGLAIGAVAGSLLFLLVQVPGLPALGVRYHFVLDLGSAGVRQVGKLMLPRALGLAVAQIGAVAVVVLASPVPGGIAALNYGQLLLMLPLGVFAMAVAQAVFPRMALEDSLSNPDRVRDILDRALGLVLFLTLPSAVALLTIGDSVVRVLWQRGQFGAGSTEMTVLALRVYAPGLVALAVTEIVSRLFYARRDTRTPVVAASIAMAVNVAIAFALSRSMPLAGIALAATVAAYVEAGIVVVLLRTRAGAIAGSQTLRTLARSAIASGLMALALLAAGAAMPLDGARPGFLPDLARLLILIATGSVVYLVVSAVLRTRELVALGGYARTALARLRR